MDSDLDFTLIQNQHFSNSFCVNGPPTIYTIQHPYMLTEAQFYDLRSSVSGLSNIIQNLIASLVVLLLNIVIRWVYATMRQGEPTPGLIDWCTLAAIVLVIFVLWILGRLAPTRRAQVLHTIEEHFQHHKPLFGSGKTHGPSDQ